MLVKALLCLQALAAGSFFEIILLCHTWEKSFRFFRKSGKIDLAKWGNINVYLSPTSTKIHVALAQRG